MIQGTYTALVTPFRNGKVDEEAFERLIEEQVAGGVDGIVPVGTTGESPTLDHEEHTKVIALAVKLAAGRVKVMAGTGSNATQEAIALTQEAEKVGADSALLVAPYYNKPSQQGLFLHYCAIADATKLPVVLYSVPGRCGIEIGVETTVRLAEARENIVAIKEAGGSVERVSQLRDALPDDFSIISGDDSLTLPFLSVGAVGVISVASNIIPAEVSQLVKAFLSGKADVAAKLHRKFYPLFKNLFIESNPVPTKNALSMLGRMSAEVRLPLCDMQPANVQKLKDTLIRCGLLG